jgi:membrane associated rhomboid family serine protease
VEFPTATAIVFALTLFATLLALANHDISQLLERDPEGLAAGQWWRTISPLFFQKQHWPLVLAGLAVFGTLAEWVYGTWLWLFIYFVCGLAGEAAAYFWQPEGAGASVAAAGLVGALIAFLVWPRPGVPRFTQFGPALMLVGAAALVWRHDIHGPPILLGALLGGIVFLWRREDVPLRA